MRVRFSAALALLCCFSAAAAVRAELVSYWPFEEFVDELSTPDVVNGYDLTVEALGAFGNDNHVAGKIGKAFEFFGGDDQALLARVHEPDDLLPINKHPAWTISMWSKVKGTGQNDWRLLSEASTTDNNPLFNIGTANNGNNDTLDIYIRNNQASTPTVNHPRTNSEPFNGEWNHIGWTFSEGTHSIYINGIFDSSYDFQSFGEIEPFQLDNTTIGGILRANPSHWVTGIIDEVAMWNEVLPGNAIAGLALERTTPPEALGFNEVVLPQFPVADDALGLISLSGEVGDIVRSEPQLTEGLAQYWYDANMRANPEAFLEAGDTGTEAYPLVNTTGPFASNTTWWAGSQNPAVISDLTLPRYPDGLIGTRFEGSSNSDNYSVRLSGEIFFSENGEYLIRDGVDDFTMIAIDQDGNGELDDLDSIVNGDVGFAPIGDVVVLDDDWANLDGSSQQSLFHGVADIENIPADGDWRRIEIWTAEGGGGDGGIVYMGNLDDPDIFDDTADGALPQAERDQFVIRNDQLRSTVSVIESANSTAALRTDVEYVMQVGTDGNDQIVVDDNDGVFSTTLNLNGAVIRVAAGEGIAEGTSFKILDADSFLGELTLLGIDLNDGWSFNSATGELTFGAVEDFLEADFNQDGIVNFTDFLVLSTQFNQTVDPPGTPPDINGNGTVDFPDFLVLSTQFNQTSGVAAAVPEPAGLALLGLGGLMLGLVRRRRG